MVSVFVMTFSNSIVIPLELGLTLQVQKINCDKMWQCLGMSESIRKFADE